MDLDSLIIYTAITGDSELYLDQPFILEGVRHLCYADDKGMVPTGWEHIPITGLDKLNNKDKNRYIKINPSKVLPNHDISLYIDYNIQIQKDVSQLVRKIIGHHNSVFLYDHPFRQCIYEEGRAILKLGLAPFFPTLFQLKRYTNSNFPKDQGLYEANIMFRKNCESQVKLMEYWWNEYQHGSKRDQISLIYSSHKTGVRISSLGDSLLRDGTDLFFLDLSKRKRKPTMQYLFNLFVNNILIKLFKI